MYRHVWVYWKHSNYNYKQHTDTHKHTQAQAQAQPEHAKPIVNFEAWEKTPSPKTCRAWPDPLPAPTAAAVSSLPSSRPCVCRRCWSCTYCALAIYYVFFVVFVAAVVYGPVQKRFCALFTCAPGGNAGALGEHVWLIRKFIKLSSDLGSAQLVSYSLIHSFNKPLANSSQSGNATRKENACV